MRLHACHCENEYCNADNSIKLIEQERDRLKARMEAAEAVIYSGLDSEDVKQAKLDAWRKTRGL